MLMDVLVGHDLAQHLGRQIVAGIAAETIFHLEFDERVGQYLFIDCA